MSKGVQNLSVGRIANPYSELANSLISTVKDSKDRAVALDVRNENERRFALGQTNLLEERGIRAANRIEDNKIKAAAVLKEQSRFDYNRNSEEAAGRAIDNIGNHVYSEKDQSLEVRQGVAKQRADWDAIATANTAYLNSGDNQEQLEKALKAYKNTLDSEKLGYNGVANKLATRRLNLESLDLDFEGLSPEARNEKIKQSQVDLFAERRAALQSKFDIGYGLTASQKSKAILASSTGVNRLEHKNAIREAVRGLENNTTADSLRASGAKSTALQNSIAVKAWNSKINAANKYNADGDKPKGDGGYGDILEVLKTKGQYGSLDEDKVTSFVQDAVTKSGISLKTAALAIHLGTTGTEGSFFDKGFPSPGSDKYIRLLASAKKIHDDSGGGAFKTIDVDSYKPPEIKRDKSIGEMQWDNFSQGKVTRSALNPTAVSRELLQSWRAWGNDEDVDPKKVTTTLEEKAEIALDRKVSNVPEENREEVKNVLRKQQAERARKALVRSNFNRDYVIIPGPGGVPIITKRVKPTPQQAIDNATAKHKNITKNSTDPAVIAKSFIDYRKAKSAFDAANPVRVAAPRSGLLPPGSTASREALLRDQAERSNGRRSRVF